MAGLWTCRATPSLKPDRDYDVLLALNGVTATLVVDGTDVFSHAFEPRVIDGLSFGLNTGMVGLGADNATARLDNLFVQLLPPEITLEQTDDFTDDPVILFAEESGDWQVNDASYDGTPDGELGVSLIHLGQSLATNSILELEATLTTSHVGGFVFDYYGPNDFKFVAVSVETDELLIGHYSRKGRVVDASVPVSLASDNNYDLAVTIKGTTVSASLGNQAIVGHVFNAVSVDGEFGLLTHNGASFVRQRYVPDR